MANYRCLSQSSSSSYPDKSKNKVYYNIDNPNECLTECDLSSVTIFYFLLILPIIGLVFPIFYVYKERKTICSEESDLNNNYTAPDSNNYNNTLNTSDSNNNYNIDGNCPNNNLIN